MYYVITSETLAFASGRKVIANVRTRFTFCYIVKFICAYLIIVRY